jgi:hypothetical protein
VLMPSIVCKTLWTFIFCCRFMESWQNKAPFRLLAEWCFAVSTSRQIGDFAFGPK